MADSLVFADKIPTTQVTVNGQAVKFNNQYGYPKLIKETERTLIPLRIISENMGYNVDWNSKNQTA